MFRLLASLCAPRLCIFSHVLCICHQSKKHVLNQPADVHVERVKAMINPEARQWTWAARNMRLRESIVIGSPRADDACPRGLTVEDINTIRGAVENSGDMPTDCTRVLGHLPGSPDGQTTVVRLEWSWKNVHNTDEDFEMVLQVLRKRFFAGQSELVDGEAPDAGAGRAGQTGVRGGRPPPAAAGSRRGSKRTVEDDPVVPVETTVRRLRHPKAAARFDKTVATAASLLFDEERRTTVVRAPYVVGQVKPFSAWPHGGIVVFAQFPFLLDPSFMEQGKMVSYCRKVLAFAVGGSYEVVFGPKRVAPAKSVAEGSNGAEPLLAAPEAGVPMTGARTAEVVAGATGGVSVSTQAAVGVPVSASASGAVDAVAGAVGAARAATGRVGPTGASRALRTPRTPRVSRANRASGTANAAAKTTQTPPGAVAPADAESGTGAAQTIHAPGTAGVSGEAATDGADDAGAPAKAAGVGGVDSAAATAGTTGAPGATEMAVAARGADAAGASGMAALVAVAGAAAAGRETGSGTSPGTVGAGDVAGTAGSSEAAGAAAAECAAGKGKGMASRTKSGRGSGGMVVPPGASPTAPTLPNDYVPIGVDLRRHFERALQNGKVECGPAENEQVEWAIVARSAPTDFSIRCVFSSAMELGRSQNMPCGSHRSNNFITAAYPARDPLEDEAEELD